MGALPASAVEKIVMEGGSARRDVADAQARFKPGDAVVARNIHPVGHTRLPRYARGKRGVVDRVHGVFVFPDTNAMGQGEQPHTLYSVCFAGDELWGADGHPRDRCYIDLWDRYLDPA